MSPPAPMLQPPALPPMREEDIPPDMLAGAMDLRVLLPDGHAVKMNVDRSTPMMDLLVHVTTANKMSTGSHIIQAIGEKGNVLPYKPSTPIGALDTWTIQIVSKSKVSGVGHKKAPLKPSNQPFEQTFRLQVNLPRNQLFVTRVSPRTPLLDVLHHVCSEKGLDPDKYDLRSPANPDEVLHLTCNLLDYKLQEVTVAQRGSRVAPRDHYRTPAPADLVPLQRRQSGSGDICDKRRKSGGSTNSGSNNNNNSGGVLGFIRFKRGSRSSVCEGSISSDSLGGQSISPARSDESLGHLRPASPTLPQAPSRGIVSGVSQDRLRNQINRQMSQRQENISQHPVVSVESSLRKHNIEEKQQQQQAPPPPVRHRKRRAPKPPSQNNGAVEIKKSSDFIMAAPAAPVAVARRKSLPVNDEEEYDEENIMGTRNIHGRCKTKADSGRGVTSTAAAMIISHSRNSSDSSGYHEASVLSESPESGLGTSGAPDTLPRRKVQQKPVSGATTHAPPFSRSLGNLAASAASTSSTLLPSSKNTSSSYTSLSVSTSSLPSQKKKKAPAPPPPCAAPTVVTSASDWKHGDVVEITGKADLSSYPKSDASSSTSSLKRMNDTSLNRNERNDSIVSLERHFTPEPKVDSNIVLEFLKSEKRPASSIPNESHFETEVPNASNKYANTSSENVAVNPVGCASKPASINKPGPAVAPKPHTKANVSVGVSQRQILNSQATDLSISPPKPKPRSKIPDSKKYTVTSKEPHSQAVVISNTESSANKLVVQELKVVGIPQVPDRPSKRCETSLSKDVKQGSSNETTHLFTRLAEDDFITDDLDLELFGGGKRQIVMLGHDTQVGDEDGDEDDDDEDDRSLPDAEEEFDEEVIRKVLFDHNRRTIADALLCQDVEETILSEVDVETNSPKDINASFCFERENHRISASSLPLERMASPDPKENLVDDQAELETNIYTCAGTKARDCQIRKLHGVKCSSSENFHDNVEVPFVTGVRKMKRRQKVESHFQLTERPFEEDTLNNLPRSCLFDGKTGDKEQEVNDGAIIDAIDPECENSVDEVDRVCHQTEHKDRTIEDREQLKILKPSVCGDTVSEKHHQDFEEVNMMPPTILPCPPPSLEYDQDCALKPLEVDNEVMGEEVCEFEWEYKLPAPPTGFQDDEEAKKDGAEEIKNELAGAKVLEETLWVVESETGSVPSTFSSATSHHVDKLWGAEGRPVQHLPNFRMSTYDRNIGSEDGWECLREDLDRESQRKRVRAGSESKSITVRDAQSSLALTNTEGGDVEKELRDVNKTSCINGWNVSQLPKSLPNKAHYSSLDLCNSMPSSYLMYRKDVIRKEAEQEELTMKNNSCVIRASSFGGKQSSVLKRSLSSTSSLISRHCSNDGQNLEEKLNEEVDRTVSCVSHSHRIGMENRFLSNSSRALSLHNLDVKQIGEEERIGGGEVLSNGFRSESTIPKIVSSKWKKSQGAINQTEICGRCNSANLRKTSSELSLSNGFCPKEWKEGELEKEDSDDRVGSLQEQFLVCHESKLKNKCAVFEGNVDAPLKSPQVLKGVMPQIANKSLIQETTEKSERDNVRKEGIGSYEKLLKWDEETKDERIPNEVDIITQQVKTIQSNFSYNNKSNSLPMPDHPSTSSAKTQGMENIAKRYSYAGPPAINFGTWNERPKSEVSLKRDSDYRIGVGQAPRVKEEGPFSQPIPSFKTPSSSQSSSSQSEGALPPKPTTMNIVSATKREQVSRLPIVRAVELKKTVSVSATKTQHTIPRMTPNGNFPSDLREELTGALAILVDANQKQSEVKSQELNERKRRQQISCNEVPLPPPPPPDVIATTPRIQTTVSGTNLKRGGSSVGQEGIGRVSNGMGQDKQHGNFLPFAPVVKGFRVNALQKQTLPVLAKPSPPPAVVCGVALKKRTEPLNFPKTRENERDELLSAIREFGGRKNLKKSAADNYF